MPPLPLSSEVTTSPSPSKKIPPLRARGRPRALLCFLPLPETPAESKNTSYFPILPPLLFELPVFLSPGAGFDNMNVPIIDPLQGDFPEVVEEYLQHGNMKCIAFNRRGTLLAAGCADGSCVIWDFETRGIAKELHDNDCVASITSICWSKYGHYILASATDKSLTLWDVVSGEKVARVTLQQPSMHVRLHPGSCTPSICLACPLSSPPILVNLNTGSSSILPVFVTDAGTVTVPHQRNKCVDSSQPLIPTAATFNKSGDLLYIGNSKGEILVVDSETVRVYAVVPVSGGSVIKNVVFSGNGKNLLTNSNDRVIRIYDNLLPEKDASRHLDAISSSMNELNGVEKLKAVGSKCLQLFHEFSDAITKIHWKATCFSGDGEWVVGASASKGEHKIYIWDRAGHLAKILEGPKEALTDLCWHPIRPLVASVSVSGWVYIWAKDYTENWSAFAPDFKELEENEEYVEREDEFDILPEAEKVKDASINQDEEADIMTVENDSAFSDFDAEKELCFLPAVPSPDVPELQDRYPGSSLLKDGSPSRSPFSVEGLNGSASNPLEVVGNSAAENKVASKNLKRKRKLSVNGFGLQVNKGPKPSMKVKPSRKTTKSKHKPGDSNGSQIEVDLTDDYS